MTDYNLKNNKIESNFTRNTSKNSAWKRLTSHLFSKNTLNAFDYFLIIGTIVTVIGISIIESEFDTIGSIVTIAGVINVVLAAKGSISNYLFGIITTVFYAIVSYKGEIYGEAALFAFFNLPMQFIGWYNWNKTRQSKDQSKVQSLKMTLKERIIWSIIALAGTIVLGLILDRFEGHQPYKDSFVTILSIIAMYLMVKAFFEQWYIWIVINIMNIIIWVIAIQNGVEHAALMIVMWTFYLANAVNGLICWKKANKVG